MNKKLLILVIVIIVLTGVLVASVSSEMNDDNALNTTSDLKQAFNDSKTQDKLILLIFDQKGCYYCDLLKEETLADKDVQDTLNNNYIVSIVDVDEQTDLAVDFKVFGTPTLVFLDGDANIVHRIEGYVSADELLDTLQEI